MTCSLIPKYSWCKGLPAVYKDYEDDKFCLFHSPKGRKGGVSVEDFNQAVMERIEQSALDNETCDLSGTVFEGDISFEGFNAQRPLKDVIFSGASFTGNAFFNRAVLDGAIDFNGTIFFEIADFTGAVFLKDAYFEAAEFKGDALFETAEFKGKARFFDATFAAWANFRMVNFRAESYFSWAAFSGGGDFDKAKFGSRFIFKRRHL